MLFKELKRHLDKPDEVYMCDLLLRGPDWVVLSYISDRDWQVADTQLPAGSQTLAFYQAGAPRVLWRMLGPQGDLRGHLFHLCRDLVIGEDQLAYQDLLLDIWVSVQGIVTVLDWDDVEACRKAGQVSPDDLRLITVGKAQILDGWRDQIAAFDLLLK